MPLKLRNRPNQSPKRKARQILRNKVAVKFPCEEPYPIRKDVEVIHNEKFETPVGKEVL